MAKRLLSIFVNRGNACSAAAILMPLFFGLAIYVALTRAADAIWAQLQRANDAVPAMRGQLNSARSPGGSVPFVTRLPSIQPFPRIAMHLQEAVDRYGVQVVGISSTQQLPSAHALGRLTIDFRLRGSYGSVKNVLADLLTRDSQSAVLQRLSMIRSPQPGNATNLISTGKARDLSASPAESNVDAHVVAVWLTCPRSEGERSAPMSGEQTDARASDITYDCMEPTAAVRGAP